MLSIETREGFSLCDSLLSARVRCDRVGTHAPNHSTVNVEKSLEENAKEYEKAVCDACGAAAGGAARPVFDLILLGMGPDGHVASLFPGHALLEAGLNDGAVVLSLSDSPKPPPRRITLTMPVICAARHAFVVTAGESKAEAVGSVRLSSIILSASLPMHPSVYLSIYSFTDLSTYLTLRKVFAGDADLPAGRVRGADVRWFIDEMAASKL